MKIIIVVCNVSKGRDERGVFYEVSCVYVSVTFVWNKRSTRFALIFL